MCLGRGGGGYNITEIEVKGHDKFGNHRKKDVNAHGFVIIICGKLIFDRGS